MWKVILAAYSLFLADISWLSTGVEANPAINWPAGSRQLHRLSHRLQVSDDGVIIYRRQPAWHFHFHSEQVPPSSMNATKMAKRSVPDGLETDPLIERQSRGESPADDRLPDNHKIAAVGNEINQLPDGVNSLGNNKTGHSGNDTKFWVVAKSVGGSEDYASFQGSPETNETLAQFFGITNIYVGGQKLANEKQSGALPDSAADCPACPTAVECPTIPEHIISTVTACESFGSSLGTCSVASLAPSGTIFILFPSSGSGGRKNFGRYLKNKKKKNAAVSVATAVVGVVAAAPNTKVKMTCPYIPADVTVTTQNGPVLPYKPREEAGFIQLIVSGTLTSEKYTMACVWASSP